MPQPPRPIPRPAPSAVHVEVCWPVHIDVLGAPRAHGPHPPKRLDCATERAGESLSGTVRLLAGNSVVIAAGDLLPVASRLALSFTLDDGEPLVALGIVSCVHEHGSAMSTALGSGAFGVLFEALRLEAQLALAHALERHMIAHTTRRSD